MGSITVVDTLIVKFGLDPKGFTDGQKKILSDVSKLEKQVEKSTKGMSSNFLAFTGKVLGIATVAVAVKKFLDYTSELSVSIRRLGLDADNYRIAAAELRNFGNVAEMNGGKAEDATKTIGGLSKAVYDLAYNGSISESLIMLGRLGVQFQDTTGNMRDFKSIALDAQASVQNLMKGGTSRANAYQMLLQAGFDPGLAQAMIQGDLGTQLAAQSNRRQVSGSDVALATKWEQSAANRSQALDAAALRQLPVEAIPGTKINNAIAATADFAGATTVPNAGRISAALDGATNAVSNFAHMIESAAQSLYKSHLPRGQTAYQSTMDKAAKKYGLPQGLIEGILRTESNFNPNAVSSTGRIGIGQLTPQFFPGAGDNPYRDIDTAGRELRRLHDNAVKRGDADDQGAWVYAMEDYNAGARGASEMRAGVRPWKQETLDYPGKVLGYASEATPSPGAQSVNIQNQRTDVTFENVTITTGAKNGEGIATDFMDMTERKLKAAQADTGMH